MDEIEMADVIEVTDENEAGYGPLPTDAASFAIYVKKVADEEFCSKPELDEATVIDGGHEVDMTGENDIVSELVKDRHYLTERKGWFVSSVFGEGRLGELHVVFQGVMRTMGDLVDVSDEMEIKMWGGLQPPSCAIVEAYAREHEERAARQWLDDVRFAIRKLQNVPEQAISQALAGQEQWMLDTVQDLNALLSRNIQ